MQAWIRQMSSYIRLRAPHHLIAAGLDGVFGPSSPHHSGRNARLLPAGSPLLQSLRGGGSAPPLDLACTGEYFPTAACTD
jgi:hypothetical protein